MSSGQFQSVFKPTPPLKGSFPLDRRGECKKFKEAFMNCMKDNKFDNEVCRNFSKEYLQCRMDKELMDKENFSKLGFKDLVDGEEDKS